MKWMRFLLLIIKFMFVLTTDKWTVTLKTDGSIDQSKTKDVVSIQVNGSDGAIPKVALGNKDLAKNSKVKLSIFGYVSEPFLVTIYKLDDDLWELDYVALSHGNKKYKFACSCMTNKTPKHTLLVSRPDVSIMTVCPSSRRSITCTGNDVINIIAAQFGRWDSFTCMSIQTKHTSCESADVQENIKKSCNGLASCIVNSLPGTNTSCYTLVVFECIENWKIAVKNKECHKPKNDVEIEIAGSTGVNRKITFPSGLQSYSVTCISLQGNIGPPNTITLLGNIADPWKMEFILLSNGIKLYSFSSKSLIIGNTTLQKVNAVHQIPTVVETCFSELVQSVSGASIQINAEPETCMEVTTSTSKVTAPSTTTSSKTSRTATPRTSSSETTPSQTSPSETSNKILTASLPTSASLITTEITGNPITTSSSLGVTDLAKATTEMKTQKSAGTSTTISFSLMLASLSTTEIAQIPKITTSSLTTGVLTSTRSPAESTSSSTTSSKMNQSNTSIEANEPFCCPNFTDCDCDCGSLFYSGCSINDVECVMAVLRKQLTVDVKSTSSFKRTKISAYDGRPSSRMIGATGDVLLVTALLIVVIPDGVRLLQFISTKLKKDK